MEAHLVLTVHTERGAPVRTSPPTLVAMQVELWRQRFWIRTLKVVLAFDRVLHVLIRWLLRQGESRL